MDESFKRKPGKFICKLNDFQIGEIIGAFAGDGSFYHNTHGRSSMYMIRYFLSYQDDKDYADYLANIIGKTNLNTNMFFRKYKGKGSTIELRACSKDLYNFIKTYIIWEKSDKTCSIRLIKDISGYSNDFLRGFVRGLMDTDGFVETYNISLGVISEGLINNFKTILDKHKIESKLSIRKNREGNRRNLYICRVLRKKDALLKILKTGAAQI